ncbi:MAG: ABC transporter permease [Synergistaceae bacterium]|jgi:ribose/xylose/arabinose/galactoside ABC-type transport system permease subunit|nr:ABC transporter permease [Synergistaceae bacterium]
MGKSFATDNKRINVLKVVDYAIYIVLVLLCVTYAIASPNFLTFRNISSMLVNNCHYLLISAGIALVLITGLTDLSVGSISYLSMVIASFAMRDWSLNPVVGLLICMLVGAIVGVVNGILMVKLKLSPLLVTLGMQLVVKGAGMMMTGSLIMVLPESIKVFMTHTVFGFPTSVLLVFLVIIILQALLSLTQFGKYVVAVGCNERAARTLGVNADNIRFACVIICDVCAALAGFYCAANLGNVLQTIGNSWEFQAIAISVLGGVSLFGGMGNVFPGVVVGFLIMAIVENGLGLIGVIPYILPTVQGMIIFIAMYADSVKIKHINRLNVQ